METYVQLQKRHQEEINNFPMKAALSKEQFKEMMESWGYRVSQTGKIVHLIGGVYIRKDDMKAYFEMSTRHKKEHEDAIKADKDGSGYIFQMFLHEMRNHEYGYTYELTDTLEALGLSYKEVKADPALSAGLEKAKKCFTSM